MFSHVNVFFVQALHMYAKIQEKLGRIRPKIQKIAHFSLVSLSPRTRSRPDAERIRHGEGRLSRPPKTALERSYFDREFQFRESHTEAETEKNS